MPADVLASPDAECALLECIFTHPPAIEAAAPIVQPAHFSTEELAQVYAGMLSLHERQIYPDVESMAQQYPERMHDIRWHNVWTRPVYLWNLSNYARAIVDTARRRMLAEAGESLSTEAVSPVQTPDDVVRHAEHALERAKADAARPAWDHKDEALTDILHDLHSPYVADRANVATGLFSLDAVTGGMRRGDLIIPAARPGVGKTSLVTTIAWHVAVTLRLPTLFFSYEMTRAAVFQKLLCLISQIPFSRMTSHHLSDREKTRVADAAETLRTSPLDVIPASSMRLSEILDIMRTRHRSASLGLVVVDYLQQIKPDRSRENRSLEVGTLSGGLKDIALELDIPVLAPAQLNRAPMERKSQEPMLSELRESGSLEQDAAVVILLWNPKGTNERQATQEIAVRVPKNRFGEKGKTTLGFRGAYTQFVDLAKHEEVAATSRTRWIGDDESF